MPSQHSGMNISSWIGVIVGALVLLAVLAGTYGPLLQQANAFKNATGSNAMAVVLVTLLPILIVSAVLLAFVYAFLYRGTGTKHRG